MSGHGFKPPATVLNEFAWRVLRHLPARTIEMKHITHWLNEAENSLRKLGLESDVLAQARYQVDWQIIDQVAPDNVWALEINYDEVGEQKPHVRVYADSVLARHWIPFWYNQVGQLSVDLAFASLYLWYVGRGHDEVDTIKLAYQMLKTRSSLTNHIARLFYKDVAELHTAVRLL